MVRVSKTKSPLFCFRYDPLIVFRRQNQITFIFIKTMSHDLLVQMAYPVSFSFVQKHFITSMQRSCTGSRRVDLAFNCYCMPNLGAEMRNKLIVSARVMYLSQNLIISEKNDQKHYLNLLYYKIAICTISISTPHLICPPKFCITVSIINTVFNFWCDHCNTQS